MQNLCYKNHNNGNNGLYVKDVLLADITIDDRIISCDISIATTINWLKSLAISRELLRNYDERNFKYFPLHLIYHIRNSSNWLLINKWNFSIIISPYRRHTIDWHQDNDRMQRCRFAPFTAHSIYLLFHAVF